MMNTAIQNETMPRITPNNFSLLEIGVEVEEMTFQEIIDEARRLGCPKKNPSAQEAFRFLQAHS